MRSTFGSDQFGAPARGRGRTADETDATTAKPPANFGPFGPIFAMDQPASSTYTRETLGWHPTHPSVLEDLENIVP